MKRTTELILIGMLVFFISSCTKDDSQETAIEVAVPPTITTTPVTSVTSYSAVTGGNVVNEGGTGVAAKGICYGTSPLPTTTGNNVTINAGNGLGAFTVNLTGLARGVQYYVRAYATNIAATVYGAQQIFTAAFTVGENYEGGIIFYVDSTAQHGLIAAPANQVSHVTWGCAGTSIAGAKQMGYGTGAQNTAAIVSVCATVGIAASICDTMSLNGYSDWFLPSYNELMFLYAQRNAIGTFLNGYYWSSTEFDSNNAYSLYFLNGTIGPVSKNTLGIVCAVRAF